MRTREWILSAMLVLGITSTAAAQGQATPQNPATTPQTPTTTTQASGTPGGSADDRPTFEVGLGYQWLRAGDICFDEDEEDCGNARTFPLGFAIDGVRNFGSLGLVGELGWSRDSEDTTFGTSAGTLNEDIVHYAVGLRVTGHNAGRFWPYGQVLFGGTTSRFDFEFDDDAVEDGLDSDTTTKFMIQPGIGATVVGGDGWGVFGQVDYRRIFLNEDEDGASGRNDFRLFLGLRVILD